MVLPTGLRAGEEDTYRERLAEFCAYAGRVAGLPVAPVIVTAADVAGLGRGLTAQIRRDAVLLAGVDPRQVLRAA